MTDDLNDLFSDDGFDPVAAVEAEEGGDFAEGGEDDQFSKLLALAEKKAKGEASDRAAFEAQMDAALRAPGDYVPSEEPLTHLERAAQEIAASEDPGALAKDLMQLLQADLDKQRAAYLASENLGPDGEPVPEPEPEVVDFSAMTSETFAMYMKAVLAGGSVDAREVPSGYSRDGFQKLVNIGMGQDR